MLYSVYMNTKQYNTIQQNTFSRNGREHDRDDMRRIINERINESFNMT